MTNTTTNLLVPTQTSPFHESQDFVLRTTKYLKKKEKDFLTNFITKASNFYGLRKIHKTNKIKPAIDTQYSEYVSVSHPSDLTFRRIAEDQPVQQTQ